MNRNITALILIVLAIGIYFTVTKDMIADVKTVQAVNTEYSAAIDSAKKLISVRDQVLKDYNSLSQDDRDRLEKMIPSTQDNIRLIIDLNNVAQRHGLALKGIHASADDKQKSVKTAPPPSASDSGISTPTLDTVDISFTVTSPYQQFINFMQDLESSLRIMDITSLTLGAADNGIYEFSVQVRTYWIRQ